MKSFKKFVAEVAQPKSKEEKNFKDQHEYEVVNHPVADPAQHTGDIGAPGLPKAKAKRKADQEGDANYDKTYAKKDDDGVKLESTEMDRARYDADDDTKKKKVTLPKAPWEKKKDEELSPKQKKIDHNKNGKIDGHDLAMIRKKKNEEADRTDDRGQDSIQTRESVELEEAVSFKKGPVRLKDGKQVMVSAQDAKLLNKMFKDLSPANQKQMEKVAMMDKAGFDEIVGFAREAL
jgi:hypothetical protein